MMAREVSEVPASTFPVEQAFSSLGQARARRKKIDSNPKQP